MFFEVTNNFTRSGHPIYNNLLQEEPILDIKDIQGHILPEYQKNYFTLIFFVIDEIDCCRHWLGKIEPNIVTMETVLKAKNNIPRTTSPREQTVWYNIAFTFPGLKKLSQDVDLFRDLAFKEGLHNRSQFLGDPVDSQAEGNCDNWLIGSPNKIPDVMVIVASDQPNHLRAAIEDIYSQTNSGLRLLFEQPGAVLPEPLREHEHFGFRDCISQPCLRGRISEQDDDFLVPRENPTNPHQGKPGFDLIWPGEFIFGYPGQNLMDSFRPATVVEAEPSWAKNGSFLVFRRLRQDVEAFRTFLNSVSQEVNHNHQNLVDLTPEKLGAKLMGRWCSGAPILQSPEQDNPTIGDNKSLNNHFKYETADNDDDSLANWLLDAAGGICPHAAHIRKAFPRDTKTLSSTAADTQTHRLLRRGIPFGEPFPDSGERGLLFLAYQTSIERQFEFITTNWMNNPNFPDTGDGHDPIVGQNHNPGENRTRIWTLPITNADGGVTKLSLKLPTEWVIPTGGGYFFVPSLTALRNFAAD